MTDLRLLRYCVVGALNTGKVGVKLKLAASIFTVRIQVKAAMKLQISVNTAFCISLNTQLEQLVKPRI